MSDVDLLNKRLAVIQSVVDRSRDIGKTKVQKVVYFLQEGLGIQLLYRFRMHHFGPFSEDIENNISVLKGFGYIEVNPDPRGYGYHITPTSREQLPWDEELNECKDDMVKAVDILNGLDTSTLELLATVHFVRHLLDEPSIEEVIGSVSRLKPKFPTQTIRSAYDQLVKANLIVEAPSG